MFTNTSSIHQLDCRPSHIHIKYSFHYRYIRMFTIDYMCINNYWRILHHQVNLKNLILLELNFLLHLIHNFRWKILRIQQVWGSNFGLDRKVSCTANNPDWEIQILKNFSSYNAINYNTVSFRKIARYMIYRMLYFWNWRWVKLLLTLPIIGIIVFCQFTITYNISLQ